MVSLFSLSEADMLTLRKLSVINLLLVLCLLSVSAPLYSAENSCSFTSNLSTEGLFFSVTSVPQSSCNEQLLTVVVKKGAEQLASLTSNTDNLPEKAWLEDVDDDGRQELLVISRRSANPKMKTLDVFSLEGSLLQQATIPDLTDRSGYRGGDIFSFEGNRIARSFPLYRSKDSDDKPTGGDKRIFYQFRNHELLQAVSPPVAIKAPQEPARSLSKSTEPVRIVAIVPKADYIEITTSSPTENYKFFRISDPWRLVIDFPNAGHDLKEHTVAIGRFGISKARVAQNKGFVRVVFDSAVSPLPSENIISVQSGVRVGFTVKK